MLDEPVSEQEFSLTRYETRFERKDATTLQIEVVRSLGRICTPSDAGVMHKLRQLISAGMSPGADRRVAQEARAAIGRIEGGGK